MICHFVGPWTHAKTSGCGAISKQTYMRYTVLKGGCLGSGSPLVALFSALPSRQYPIYAGCLASGVYSGNLLKYR